MAKPADRVQLHKQESVANGGDAADVDPFLSTCPLEPNEDAPEVAGIYFQEPAPSTVRDEEVYISRDASGNMCFRDPNANGGTEIALSALGGLLPLEKILFSNGCFVITGCDFVGNGT